MDAYAAVRERTLATPAPLDAIGLLLADDPKRLLAEAAESFGQGDLRAAAGTLDRLGLELDRASSDGACAWPPASCRGVGDAGHCGRTSTPLRQPLHCCRMTTEERAARGRWCRRASCLPPTCWLATEGCTCRAPKPITGIGAAASTTRRAAVAQPVLWERIPRMAVSYRPKEE